MKLSVALFTLLFTQIGCRVVAEQQLRGGWWWDGDEDDGKGGWWDRNVCDDMEGTVDLECGDEWWNIFSDDWWNIFGGCEKLTCENFTSATCDDEIKLACPATCATGCQTVVDAASGDDDLSTLVELLGAADLAADLTKSGPFGRGFTVLAPDNAAFAKLPAELVERLQKPEWEAHLEDALLYHVAPGKVLSGDLYDGKKFKTLNGNSLTTELEPEVGFIDSTNNKANVIEANIEVTNGVIHKIDSVLVPPSASTSIVDKVVAAASNEKYPEFTTLLGLLKREGLAETLEALKGEGPFTVFAPTDKAFAKIGKETLESLSDDAVDDILKYHVVAKNALSTSLSKGQEVTTLQGNNITVTSIFPFVTLNKESLVIKANILLSNGIIHIIDDVLDTEAGTTDCADTEGPFVPDEDWNFQEEEYNCDDIAGSWWLFKLLQCVALSDYCPESCDQCF